MKSEVSIGKGQCFKTKTAGDEAVICLGNTSGYVISKEKNTFYLIFMTGALSSEFELNPHIEKELKSYYK